MKLGTSALFEDVRQLKPKTSKTLTPEEASAFLTRQQVVIGQMANLRPSHLVHRNYFWLLIDGPGILFEEFNYDDFFFPDPPKFDYITVSLMGSNFTFSDDQGRPAPYPLALSWINCGEIPESHKFWTQVGFLDPYLDHSTGTVQLLPWSGAIQIGVMGWNFA